MQFCLISYDSYFLFKQIVGLIFIFDLLYFAPWLQMMFGTAYQANSPVTNRTTASLLFLIWLCSALSLIFHTNSLLGCLLLTVIFRFYYLESRTTNLFRGGGAVGIMPAAIVSYLTLTELFQFANLDWINAQFILFLMVFHIGIIMFDSALNKMKSGFFVNQGFQFALYNPFWTYWSKNKDLRKIPPSCWKIINFILPISQCLIAMLVISPPYQWLGVCLLTAGFACLTFVVRLGTLTILISSLVILYVNHYSVSFVTVHAFELIEKINPFVLATGLTYLITLVLGQLLVWCNFYLNFFLWKPLQVVCNVINSHLPILIWRVFTPDVVNLYCLIYEVEDNGGRRLLNKSNFTTDLGNNLFHKLRFLNVAASCLLSSIFNSIKYNRNNHTRAIEKIKQYCKTLEPHLSYGQSSIEFDVFHIMLHDNNLPLDKIVSKWVYDGTNVKQTYSVSNSDDIISSFIRPYAGSGSYK